MTVEKLAAVVLDACDTEGVDHLITGAFAISVYGIPRSTKDVDVLVNVTAGDPVRRCVLRLESMIEFDPQVQFDTLTWGKRVVGVTRESPPLKVELFELFNDPFVLSQFARKRQRFSEQIGRTIWLPTPEDVVVQKLRWGRNKDLDDARDVLAVQGSETLDMAYIVQWCALHRTTERLRAALASIPPL